MAQIDRFMHSAYWPCYHGQQWNVHDPNITSSDQRWTFCFASLSITHTSSKYVFTTQLRRIFSSVQIRSNIFAFRFRTLKCVRTRSIVCVWYDSSPVSRVTTINDTVTFCYRLVNCGHRLRGPNNCLLVESCFSIHCLKLQLSGVSHIRLWRYVLWGT